MRIDYGILELLTKRKLINLDKAKHFASLPLVVTEKNVTEEYGKYLEEKKSFKAIDLICTEQVIFEEYMAYLIDGSYLHLVMRDYFLAEVEFFGPIGEVYIKMSLDSKAEKSTFYSFDKYVKHGVSHLSEANKDELNKLGAEVIHLYCKLMLWINFNIISDKYEIGEKPVKRKNYPIGFRRELAKDTGPRILFLDKLPGHSWSRSDGTGKHVSDHRRRGYYKTLRHEMYKNHPKYMIENAIYVRPSYVGDVERIHAGNVYTVWGW
jgi:hypothetical protein